MAYLYIDTDKAIQASQELVAIARQLNGYQRSLEGIKLSRTMSRMGGERVEKTLRRLLEEVGNEAVKMNSLGGALQAVVNQYRKTENTIVGMQTAEKTAVTDNSASGENKNWWDKFWAWITGKDKEEEVSPQEQEKAADEAMRKQLKDVLKDKKYSKRNWKKASVEERKQILQDYMDEVIRIYGLQDVKTSIRWDSNATYNKNSITWGYYSPGTHIVTLNERALSDSVSTWNSYDLLGTVAHELRHAYQHEAVEHPENFTVSPETREKWANNFENYISSSDDYEKYRAQPIEVDARSFEVKRGWF